MPSYSQYVPNIPDGETIVTTAGKLALNKDDIAIKYGSYGGATNKVYSSIVPIGTILPWAKSLGAHTPALPSCFVECSGQVLNDASSPYNGDTMPDLNGGTTQRFLYGSSTSGTTGGSASFSWVQGNGQSGSGRRVASDLGGETGAGTFNMSKIPPYYEVVFIIRIK